VKKLRAILVDDEESARDVLRNLLQRFCPEIEVITACVDLTEAIDAIKEHQPDIVFLDIEMPNYAGYEIVHFFDTIDFQIIFVTAYDQYAIRAFEIAAIDYLLKPIDIDRLKEAVAKAQEQVNLNQVAAQLNLLKNTLHTKEFKSIVILDKGYSQIIELDQIVAIEAQEAYCQIHTLDEKKYTVSKNLKYYESLFADIPRFFRVHKSWLINKDYIINYSKTELIIHLENEVTAKLSKYKKTDFEKEFTS